MRRRPLASIACALLLAACGSSPDPTFFALAPTRGVTAPLPLRTVRVRRPGLAGYLDRPQIVARVVDYRLGVRADDRWGEPLDAMLGRVLAADIAARCPGTTVFEEGGAITADPDATVEVDVQRFDVGASGELELVAQVAVERGAGHAPASARPVMLRARPVGAATSALVAAMSDLLGQLADAVVAALRAA